MKTKIIQLEPLVESQFKELFISEKKLEKNNLDPVKYFEPIISQFQILSIGPYFWMIADSLNWKVLAAGGNLVKVANIELKEFVGKAPTALFEKVYPTDLMKMFAFSKFWIQYYVSLSYEKRKHVKATTFIRIFDEVNKLKWVMCQYPDQIISENGNPLFGLIMLTDLTNIKHDGSCKMSIYDSFDGTYQIVCCNDKTDLDFHEIQKIKITKRESEVVLLLAKGFSSKQIADNLKISINTVSNHRQNLLHKTQSKSSAELVNFVTRNGLI